MHVSGQRRTDLKKREKISDKRRQPWRMAQQGRLSGFAVYRKGLGGEFYKLNQNHYNLLKEKLEYHFVDLNWFKC